MTGSFLDSLPQDERSAFIDGVFDLARTGRQDELQEMLNAGVPVNLTNGRNDTLLIVATYAQQAQVVALLLERGANLDHVNNMGQTAVSCAVFRNDAQLLEMLIARRADTQAGAHSALAIAQQFGLTDMVTRLEAL